MRPTVAGHETRHPRATRNGDEIGAEDDRMVEKLEREKLYNVFRFLLLNSFLPSFLFF